MDETLGHWPVAANNTRVKAHKFRTYSGTKFPNHPIKLTPGKSSFGSPQTLTNHRHYNPPIHPSKVDYYTLGIAYKYHHLRVH